MYFCTWLFFKKLFFNYSWHSVLVIRHSCDLQSDARNASRTPWAGQGRHSGAHCSPLLYSDPGECSDHPFVLRVHRPFPAPLAAPSPPLYLRLCRRLFLWKQVFRADWEGPDVPSTWLNCRQVSSWLWSPGFPFLRAFTLKNMPLKVLPLPEKVWTFHRSRMPFSRPWSSPLRNVVTWEDGPPLPVSVRGQGPPLDRPSSKHRWSALGDRPPPLTSMGGNFPLAYPALPSKTPLTLMSVAWRSVSLLVR